MDNICAIIDAQGFVRNKKFIPREIAIASNNMMSMCFEIDCEIKIDDLSVDKITNNYIKHNIHGLDYKPKTDKFLKANDVPSLLRNL
jgi:hypothetical protein